MKLAIKNLKELDNLAKNVASVVEPGTKILFEGEVGTGKTTFITHFARHFQIKEAVTSPTFTLINQYSGKFPVFHLDLYRINSSEELYSLDIDQFLDTRESLVLIEWADRLEDILPADYLKMSLEYVSATERSIHFSANGLQADTLLKKINIQ